MVRWITRMLIGVGGLSLLTLAVLTYYFGDDFMLGRSLSRDSLVYPVIITDRYGQELHRIFGNENREWIDLDSISDHLKTATILAEDHRFREHHGIDFKGIARATWHNFQTGEYDEGASTLTQQIARKVYLTDQKTIKRKLREMAIALGIESKFSKDEVLEMYLNTVPYGPRINGVKLAADTYFDKTPLELTMAESLILAALPKDPVGLSKKPEIWQWLSGCKNYWVCSSFEEVDDRSKRIEKLLFTVAKAENWEISQTKATWEEMAQIKLGHFQKAWTDDDFQHWRFFVLDFLESKGFDFSLHHQGLIIRTSLDKDLQLGLYKSLLEGPSQKMYTEFGIENFALMILDNETRGPLTWIGSKYFWNKDIDGQVDMLRSRRQVGSTIKPFTYALAIHQGYQPPTLLSDTPIRFTNDTHRVSNSDSKFYGRMTMGTALNWSRNIPAIKVFYLAGGEFIVRHYLDEWFHFGIDETYGDHKFGWSLAIGSVPLRLMDLGNAYSTLGTGQYQEICPILSIQDSQGNPILSPCVAKKAKPMEPSTNFFVNDMLSDLDKRPWRWTAVITPPDYPRMAIKTGTASKRVGQTLLPTDNLVSGYTPEATILMWAGNTDGAALKDGSLAVNSIGAMWRNIATQFFTRYPEKYTTFEMPADLKDTLVKVRDEWALVGYEEKPYNELYQSGIVDLGAWLNDPDYVALASLEEGADNEPEIAGPRPPVEERVIEKIEMKKTSSINLEKVSNWIRQRRQSRGAGY
ncbi:MAG TPA: transglycosylase domain-containing protein [Candidatus Gracilibacteria bacterium]